MNLLKNGNFEADWGNEKSHRCLVIPEAPAPMYEKDVENIHTPPGWLVWFRHTGKFAQPEVKDAWITHDANRVHSGKKGIKFFTTGRLHDGGFLQQVNVKLGTELRLAAFAHSWSNHKDPDMFQCWDCFANVPIEKEFDFAPCPKCGTGINRDCLLAFPHPDDGRWSEGAEHEAVSILKGETDDANLCNFTFYLGIDPTGGTDPLADSVIWGIGAHIFNEYASVPPVEAVAQGDTVTVFVRSVTLYAFKHNDFYLDDVELVALNGAPPADPIEWDYPVIEKGGKLGVHTLRPNRVQDYAQMLADGGARFSVVKAVDDLSTLIAIKQRHPDTITIGRLTSKEWEHCQEVSTPGADLDRLADRLLGKILKKIASDSLLIAAVDYWEICNEPDPPHADGYTRLSELMIICMEKAEKHGLKLAIFSLNFGTPEWDEMQAMVASDVFTRARAGGHIMTLHEGLHSAKDPIDKWHGNTIPGSPVVEGAGSLNFRYRYLYSLIPDEQKIPLVVSEWCGYDQRGLSAQNILERIVWYDTLMRRDYYAWAFCPFTLGPTGEWKTHDYEKVYPMAVEYMVKTKDEPNALLPTQPEPQPPSGRGAPREQYARTYVLLPPPAGAAWAHAVVAATWDNRRYTIGPSADDAGLGDLDVRNVIAVNPGDWPTDLLEFYRKYYPGVNVTCIEAKSPPELLALLSEAL